MAWYEDMHGAARIVAFDEIAANDWNLNIPRYTEPLIEEDTLTAAKAMENLKQALGEAYSVEDYFKALLVEADLK